MPTTTITFNDLAAGDFRSYASGLWSVSNSNNSLSFSAGQTYADLGSGQFMFISTTATPAQLMYDSGKLFGVLSLRVDGFQLRDFTPPPGDGSSGTGIPVSSAATVVFKGYKPGAVISWTYTLPDNGRFEWETINLPDEFQSGLFSLEWFTVGGSGLMFVDDIVVQENRAPVAGAFTGSVAADGSLLGQLAGSDPDGQAVFYRVVGARPDGVNVDPRTGQFEVVPQESDLELTQGQSRTITFQYETFDGEKASAPATVTVSITGVQAPGIDRCGTVHPDYLEGNSGNDSLCGDNQNDTLVGLGGADRLSGDNGQDELHGGRGTDTLIGGNGKDTLWGGEGDDRLSGNNGNDLFVFDAMTGNDVITDFDPKNDQIQFTLDMFGADATFEGVMSRTVQSGKNVVISYEAQDGSTHTITLLNLSRSALKSDDFLFSF